MYFTTIMVTDEETCQWEGPMSGPAGAVYCSPTTPPDSNTSDSDSGSIPSSGSAACHREDGADAVGSKPASGSPAVSDAQASGDTSSSPAAGERATTGEPHREGICSPYTTDRTSWKFWNWFKQDPPLPQVIDRRAQARNREQLSHLLNQTVGTNEPLRAAARFNGEWPGEALDTAKTTIINVATTLTPFPGDDAFLAARPLAMTPQTWFGVRSRLAVLQHDGANRQRSTNDAAHWLMERIQTPARSRRVEVLSDSGCL